MEDEKTENPEVEKRILFAKESIIPDLADVALDYWGTPTALLDPNDNTTQADINADDLAIDIICKSDYKKDCIITEERAKKGEIINPNSRYSWVIDALDGSSNHRKGIPVFAASIAVKEDTKLKGGVVYAPMERKLFYAVPGRKAQLEDNLKGVYKDLRVSKTENLRDATISTVSSNSYKKHGLLGLLQELQPKVRDNKQLGCTSLEFAYTAMGTLDGVVKPTKNPWGVGAGIMLVEGAGGKVKSFKKGELYIHVASNPFIHDELCGIVENYLLKN